MRWLVVLLMPLMACGPHQRPPQPKGVAISVAENGVVALIVTQDGSYPFTRLQIALTNLSSAPLSLDVSSLPWVSPYSLRLHVTSGAGQPLRLFYPIWDLFRVDTVSLPPGATITGTYELGWQVEEIDEVLARGPVRVDWVYPSGLPGVLDPIGIGPTLRGTIVLPQASLDPDAV